MAESAFGTQINLASTGKMGLKVISRLPATYDLVEILTRQAFADNGWLKLGQLAGGRNKASDQLKEYPAMLYNQQYRFLGVRSSQLDKRELGKLDNQVKREQELLEKAILKLEGSNLLRTRCQDSAEGL